MSIDFCIWCNGTAGPFHWCFRKLKAMTTLHGGIEVGAVRLVRVIGGALILCGNCGQATFAQRLNVHKCPACDGVVTVRKGFEADHLAQSTRREEPAMSRVAKPPRAMKPGRPT